MATATAVSHPTKKELRKLLTAWKNGKISKVGIDVSLGRPAARGKYIDAQWRDRLGVATSGRYPNARTA